jgi:hypothetical protein
VEAVRITASVTEVAGTKHATRKRLVDNRELIGKQTQKTKDELLFGSIE